MYYSSMILLCVSLRYRTIVPSQNVNVLDYQTRLDQTNVQYCGTVPHQDTRILGILDQSRIQDTRTLMQYDYILRVRVACRMYCTSRILRMPRPQKIRLELEVQTKMWGDQAPSGDGLTLIYLTRSLERKVPQCHNIHKAPCYHYIYIPININITVSLYHCTRVLLPYITVKENNPSTGTILMYCILFFHSSFLCVLVFLGQGRV